MSALFFIANQLTEYGAYTALFFSIVNKLSTRKTASAVKSQSPETDRSLSISGL